MFSFVPRCLTATTISTRRSAAHRRRRGREDRDRHHQPREFVAGALSFQPLWIKALFGARIILAKPLRLETATVPPHGRLRPETVSFTPGDPAAFFKVARSEEDHYLLLKITDNHLDGYLAFITDDSPDAPEHEFKVVTLVFFHRKIGRAYYDFIRPVPPLGDLQHVPVGQSAIRTASVKFCSVVLPSESVRFAFRERDFAPTGVGKIAV